MYEANNNMDRALICINNFVKEAKEDNSKIVDAFRRDYPKYI